MMAHMTDKLLTTGKVATVLGLARNTILVWAKDGQLDSIRVGKRHFIKKSTLKQYIEEKKLESVVNWAAIGETD